MTEISGQLRESGTGVMRAGQAVLTFDPDNSRQRWEVSAVTVSTDQAANAAPPNVAVALNARDAAVLSNAGVRHRSWEGGMATLAVRVRVSPGDCLTVLFTDPAGVLPIGADDGIYLDIYTDAYPGASSFDGVRCYAQVTGTRYTRRA